MIAGAVNQAGIKEDRPDIKLLPQTLTGFEQVFETAQDGKTPASSPKPLAEREADPRLRTHHAKESGRNDRPPREEIAGDEHQDALRRADAPAQPIQKAPREVPPSPTEEAAAVDVPAKALERTDGKGDVVTHQVLPSMMGQVGAAAYRLSPHGVTEQQAAEHAGKVPLGETLDEGRTLGGEASRLENTVLFAKPKPTADVPVQANLEKGSGLQVGDTKLLTPVDILNLSRETAEDIPQPDKSLFPRAELDFAQARNELMMRLGQGAAQVGQGAAQGSPGAAQGGQGAAGQPGTATILPQAVPMPLRPQDVGVANPNVFRLADEGSMAPGLSPTSGAATAAARLGQDPAAVRTEQIIQRIVQQARWMFRNNRSEVTFKLQPEHLGDVHLKVVQADGKVRVDMTVDNLGVKHLVESRLHDLHNRMAEQQMAQGQFEFNVDVRQGDGFRQPQSFALSGAGTRREPAGLPTEPETATGGLGRTRPIWGRAGSGIYV